MEVMLKKSIEIAEWIKKTGDSGTELEIFHVETASAFRIIPFSLLFALLSLWYV